MRKILLLIFFLTFSVMAKKNKEYNKQQHCMKNYNKGLTYAIDGENSRAVSILSQVRLDCIGGIDSPDSLYYFLGKAYLNGKKPDEARLEFKSIVENYPHSIFLEDASYNMAYCTYKAAPQKNRDSHQLRQALREFNTFVANYPTSSKVKLAQEYIDTIFEKLVSKEINEAEFYEIIEKWDSAIIYYNSILHDYPSTKQRDFIQLQIAKDLVEARRYTEATNVMHSLADRGLYIDELKSLQKEMEKQKAKAAKKRKRKERKDKKEEE